jgi:hypothetical protein
MVILGVIARMRPADTTGADAESLLPPHETTVTAATSCNGVQRICRLAAAGFLKSGNQAQALPSDNTGVLASWACTYARPSTPWCCAATRKFQDRTQRKKSRAQTLTHDDKRHGTTTLFTMNVLDGKVTSASSDTPMPSG